MSRVNNKAAELSAGIRNLSMKKLFLIASLISGLGLAQAEEKNLFNATVKDYVDSSGILPKLKEALRADYGRAIAKELSDIVHAIDKMERKFKEGSKENCEYKERSLPRVHTKEDEEKFEKEKSEWIAGCQEYQKLLPRKLIELYRERLEKILETGQGGLMALGGWKNNKDAANTEEQLKMVIKDLKERGF